MIINSLFAECTAITKDVIKDINNRLLSNMIDVQDLKIDGTLQDHFRLLKPLFHSLVFFSAFSPKKK